MPRNPNLRWELFDYNTGEFLGSYLSQAAATRAQNYWFNKHRRETEWKRVTVDELEMRARERREWNAQPSYEARNNG